MREKIIANLKILKERILDFLQRDSDKKLPIHISRNLITGELSDNPRVLIKSLMNSNDETTANLGYFLSELECRYNIRINSDMMKYLLLNLDVDVFANPIYKNRKLDYYQAICYGCVVNNYNHVGQYGVLLETFESLLSRNQNSDREFELLMGVLEDYVTRNPYDALGKVLDDYQKIYIDGNKEEVLANLRKLLILLDLYGVKILKTTGLSYCDSKSKIIGINNVSSDVLVTIHEIGHMIDNYYRNSMEIDKKVLSRAYKFACNNPFAEIIIKAFCNAVEIARTESHYKYQYKVNEKYGNNDRFIGALIKYIYDTIKSQQFKRMFEFYNLSNEDINAILSDNRAGKIRIYDLALTLYKADLHNFEIKYMGNTAEAVATDIISAIFKTSELTFNGESFYLPIAHNSEYYNRDERNSMAEIMANYNVLKVAGRSDIIRALSILFGEELINYLESIYQRQHPKKRKR